MGTFIAVSLIVVALSPGPIVEFPSVSNPFGVEAATLPGPVLTAGQLGVLACVVATILSLVLRFYRSRGEERLPLKWFTYAATVGFTTPLLLNLLAPAAFEVLGRLLWTFGFLSLPGSIGIAILEHRLYDIDLVINRTLVYGSLTAMLALIYFGGVAGLQRLLSPLAGEGNGFAVVASTLLIAALFGPLRRRLQGFIDRRFYRNKYDARKTLESFSAKLRGALLAPDPRRAHRGRAGRRGRSARGDVHACRHAGRGQLADLELAYSTFTAIVGLAAAGSSAIWTPTHRASGPPVVRPRRSGSTANSGKAFSRQPICTRLEGWSTGGRRTRRPRQGCPRRQTFSVAPRGREWLLDGFASTLLPSASRCRFCCSARFSKNFWARALVTRPVTGPSRWKGTVVA
jgi:hypothetical protein